MAARGTTCTGSLGGFPFVEKFSHRGTGAPGSRAPGRFTTARKRSPPSSQNHTPPPKPLGGFWLSSGVDSAAVSGNAGGASALTPSKRASVLKAGAEVAAGKVPIGASINSSLLDACELGTASLMALSGRGKPSSEQSQFALQLDRYPTGHDKRSLKGATRLRARSRHKRFSVAVATAHAREISAFMTNAPVSYAAGQARARPSAKRLAPHLLFWTQKQTPARFVKLGPHQRPQLRVTVDVSTYTAERLSNVISDERFVVLVWCV